ncbi:hypothetical protein AHAS_Ahas15G0207900 [Arachis hypogaea]
MSYANGSPHRPPPPDTDLEAGPPTARSGDFDDGDVSDPFDITRTKNASIERLRRWRQAALVLNASCRFRYTLDLKKQEEKTQILRKIRAHAQAIRAAYLFKAAGDGQVIETTKPPVASAGEFPIGQEQLASVSREHDTVALQQYGGVAGISNLLKTNLEKGIHERKKFLDVYVGCLQGSDFDYFNGSCSGFIGIGIKSEGIEEGWYDGGSIAFAVILVIVVTAISDYKQSLQFRNLNEEKRNIHLEVIRGGRRIEISIEIVVGDVIPLNIGNQVPADGILITGHSLAIDESSMTGESKIVHKDSKDPFLMSGCKVADGSGTMLVTGVGVNTEWGLLMASISEDTGEETPLQVRLNGVATFIGIVGLSVAVVVLIVLLARFFSGHTRDASGNVQFKAGKTKVGDAIDGAIKIVTVAVTIVVVAVPEGLPLAVTLTLAYSMRKMMADKALVRRLSACETMGYATTICSDKTCTLTMNQMTEVEAYAGGKKNDPPGNKSELSPKLHSLLIEGVAQNTNGSVFVPAGGNDVEVARSPTEKAILHWGLEADSEVHIHWKGAAEIVLACCTRYIDANDQLVDMDEEKMVSFRKAIEDMAAESLRCVAIAYRTFEKENVPATEEERAHWSLPEDNLVLLAIVGLKDPCRPGVKDSVELCQKSGVKVKMVTLMSKLQKQLLWRKNFSCHDRCRDEIAEAISVRRQQYFQALKRESIEEEGTCGCLAMGIQGTEVTKESSDIIILDDNFASIVKDVRWGRSVYANIQKFIQFQLTVNVAALVINVVAAVSSGDVPLNAVQLLWVNLIMDTLGALALATEPRTDHLMYLIMDTLGALALATEPPTDHLMRTSHNKYYVEKFADTGNVPSICVACSEFPRSSSSRQVHFNSQLISVIIGFRSWPLAVVGKFIPVPNTPINNVFSRLNLRPHNSNI